MQYLLYNDDHLNIIIKYHYLLMKSELFKKNQYCSFQFLKVIWVA